MHLMIASRCAKTIAVQRMELARGARESGWEVTLAGEFVEGPYLDNFRAEQFSFTPIPVNQSSLNPFALIRLLILYMKLIRKTKIDVFHAFTIKPTVAGLLAAWISRVPVRIATVAGLGHVFLTSSRLVNLVSVFMLRISMKCAHIVFFYNRADCEEYISRSIIPRSKARLVPGSGIDTSRFDISPLPSSEPFTLAFVGRLIAEKGIVELFDALVECCNRGLNVHLNIIGDVDSNNPSSLSADDILEFKKICSVVWHGHLADIRPVISRSHAVVLPSHREGIPLALLEGAAMGRALIATDVPGCRDVVVHGKTGLLTPLGDVDALANAIQMLACDIELVARLGAAARDEAISKFDARITTGIVLREYKQVYERN